MIGTGVVWLCGVVAVLLVVVVVVVTCMCVCVWRGVAPRSGRAKGGWGSTLGRVVG